MKSHLISWVINKLPLDSQVAIKCNPLTRFRDMEDYLQRIQPAYKKNRGKQDYGSVSRNGHCEYITNPANDHNNGYNKHYKHRLYNRNYHNDNGRYHSNKSHGADPSTNNNNSPVWNEPQDNYNLFKTHNNNNKYSRDYRPNQQMGYTDNITNASTSHAKPSTSTELTSIMNQSIPNRSSKE